MRSNQNQKVVWQFKALEYLAYFGVFVIPLYVNYNHWYPFSTPKALLLIGITSCMILLYAWGRWKEHSPITLTKLHVVLLVFFAVLTLSSIYGVDMKHSFFGTFSPIMSLSLFYFIAIFSCFIGFLIKKNKSFLSTFLTFLFMSSLVVASITYLGHDAIKLSSNSSTIGNNSYLGAYLMLSACFGIGLFFLFKQTWQKILIGFGLLVIFLSPVFLNRAIWKGDISFIHNPILLLGEADGAAIGLGIAIIVMILLWMTRLPKKIFSWLGVVLFICFIGGLYILGGSFVNSDSNIHKIYLEEKNENRFIFWDIARQGFLERPLLGYGFGNYRTIYQKHFNADVYLRANSPEIWVDQPHNVFFEYVSTTGIVGFIAYCSLLGILLISLYNMSGTEDRSKRIFGIVLSGAVFGYVFQDMFIFDTVVPLLLFFIIVGITIGLSKDTVILDKFFPNYIKKIVLLVLGIIGIASLVILVILPWRESKKWGTLVTTKSLQELAVTTESPQNISFVGDLEDSAYATDRFLGMINGALPKITTPDDKKDLMDTIDFLQNNLEKELKDEPVNYRAQISAGNLLIMKLLVNKNFDESIFTQAQNHFQAAATISPQNPMTYIYMANAYGFKNDTNSIYTYLRIAIATAPEFKLGYDYAEQIIKKAPDKNFENYVNTMKEKWMIH